jgi:pilus assembly protein CpaB
MDRRRLLLILAVFVALIGTGLVFLYVQNVKSNAVETTDVVVAKVNIAANETYDAALAAGKVEVQAVPVDYAATVPNAVTATSQLQGQEMIAQSDIFAGQVLVSDAFAETAAPATSTLTIPPGMIAISVNLTDPDRVAGNIQNGSEVAIFVTGTLQTNAQQASAVQSTRLLLPKVTVLNVGSPQPPTTSTTTDPESGTQTTEQLPRTLLTIAVTQKEAQKVIVSSKALDLTFGLLTDKSVVHPGKGTSTLVTSLFRG